MHLLFRRTGPMLRSCVVMAAVFLAACAPDAPDNGAASTAIADGKAVFDKNCAVCHGVNNRGPALTTLKALPSAARADRIRNHPQAGNISERLSAAELLQLFELFANAKPGASPPTGTNGEVFMQQCGACHGGGGRGPAFSEISQISRDDFERQLRNHPVAGTIPQRLASIDLANLIAFFESP